MNLRISAAAAALVSLSACAASASPPPAALGAAPFYTQYRDASGIPVLSSDRVDPATLEIAEDIVEGLLAHRPDLRAYLVSEDYRVAIMAQEEAITDLPEMAHWTKPGTDDPRLTRCERKHYDARIGALSDRQYWNARVRGIGGDRTVGAEEDLLGLKASRYYGQTIFLHEFSHNVLQAIEKVDPALYGEVQRAYDAAKAAGRWRDEYAMTTIDEYWAVGSQFWFNSAALVVVDGRQILNHVDLIDYDPALAEVLMAAYGQRHRIESDPFYMSEARVPPGPIPQNTAEVC